MDEQILDVRGILLSGAGIAFITISGNGHKCLNRILEKYVVLIKGEKFAHQEGFLITGDQTTAFPG